MGRSYDRQAHWGGSAGVLVAAREIFPELAAACKENVPTDMLALYHEVQGELQQLDGVLSSWAYGPSHFAKL